MPGTQEIDKAVNEQFEKAMREYTLTVQNLVEEGGSQLEINRVLNEARQFADKWARQDLSKLYRDSYNAEYPTNMSKSASGRSNTIRKRFLRNANHGISEIETWSHGAMQRRGKEELLGKINKNLRIAKQEVESGGLSPKQKEFYHDAIKKGEAARKELLQEIGQFTSEEPKVRFLRRRKKGQHSRGTVASNRNADEYWSMLAKTAQKDVGNRAYLLGLQESGVEWVIVSDGTDCGWANHRDSEKANGKVVQVKEVIPYAHPYCQRDFAGLPDGPRSGKSRDLIEKMTGARDRNALAAMAKTGSVLGQVGGAGSFAYNNQLTHTVIRAILDDREIALGENAQKILNRWANPYERSEAIVLAQQGRELTSIAIDDLRTKTMQGVERKIAAIAERPDSHEVHLTKTQATVLKFSDQTVSKGQLLNRFEDYANYVRWTTDRNAQVMRSVGAAAQDEAMLRRLLGTSYIPKIMTHMGRGQDLLTDLKKIDKIIRETFAKNPQLAEVEMIKLLATAIEPIPWIRSGLSGDLGSLRFSIGITAEGRRDLAKTLYIKMRGQDFREKLNVVYQKNHLGHVMKTPRITTQDIYNALLPRMSFMGNPIHFSIAAESGKIVPIVHVFPDVAYLRALSLRWRLSAGTINDLIKEGSRLSDGEFKQWAAAKLKDLPEEMIWTIDLFRNGPITASIRMLSDGIDSYAIKLRPDNDLIRGYRRVFTGTRDAPGTKQQLIAMARERGYLANSSMTVDQLRAIIGPIERPKLTSLAILPDVWGGIPISLKTPERIQEFLGFAKMKGSILEATKSLGMDYRRTLVDLKRYVQDEMTVGWNEILDRIADGADHKGFLNLDIDLSTDAGLSEMRSLVARKQDFKDYRKDPSLILVDISNWFDGVEASVKTVFSKETVDDLIRAIKEVNPYAEIDLTGVGYTPGFNFPMIEFEDWIDPDDWALDWANPIHAFQNIPFRDPRTGKRWTEERLRAHMKEVLPGDAAWMDYLSFDYILPITDDDHWFRSQRGLSELVTAFDYLERNGLKFKPPKNIRIAPLGDGTFGLNDAMKNELTISNYYMDNRLDIGQEIQRLVDVNHFNPVATSDGYVAVHELGHHLTMNLTSEQKMIMWNRMMEGFTEDWIRFDTTDLNPDGVREWMKPFFFGDEYFEFLRADGPDAFAGILGKDYSWFMGQTEDFFHQIGDELIMDNVGSYYAGTNAAEFMAEAFAIAIHTEPELRMAVHNAILYSLEEFGYNVGY